MYPKARLSMSYSEIHRCWQSQVYLAQPLHTEAGFRQTLLVFWFSRSSSTNLDELGIERITIGDVFDFRLFPQCPLLCKNYIFLGMKGAFLSSVSSPPSFPATRMIFRQPIESLCCSRDMAPCSPNPPPRTHGCLAPFIPTFLPTS